MVGVAQDCQAVPGDAKGGYARVLRGWPVEEGFLNSVLVTPIITALYVAMSTIVGYALGKHAFARAAANFRLVVGETFPVLPLHHPDLRHPALRPADRRQRHRRAGALRRFGPRTGMP